MAFRKMTAEGPGRPKLIQAYRPAIFVLALAAFASVLTSSAPSMACLRTPSLAFVDAALARGKLSGPAHAKAVELRAELSDLISQHRRREALQVEAQIMEMMGFRFLKHRLNSWGRGCGGRWVAKTN
jgi:hypothetical protein